MTVPASVDLQPVNQDQASGEVPPPSPSKKRAPGGQKPSGSLQQPEEHPPSTVPFTPATPHRSGRRSNLGGLKHVKRVSRCVLLYLGIY